jgi:DNA-binding NarL/FixJ family response regulator
MNPPSILIVDDHPIYRDALCEKLTIDFNSLGVEVLSASSLEEAVSTISRGQKNWLILLDLILPKTTPLIAISKLKEDRRVMHVIAMSGLEADEWSEKCIAAGATAFISKNNTSNHIYTKICELLKIRSADAESSSNAQLTKRQLEVLGLMSKGTSNKIIADQLDISEQTVKIHINAIFRFLKVSNRTQAVYKSQMLKLI